MNADNIEISEKVARGRSEALVIALVGKNASDWWWNSPNKAFDMTTPNDMWKIDFHRVYEYLMRHGFSEGS